MPWLLYWRYYFYWNRMRISKCSFARFLSLVLTHILHIQQTRANCQSLHLSYSCFHLATVLMSAFVSFDKAFHPVCIDYSLTSRSDTPWPIQPSTAHWSYCKQECLFSYPNPTYESTSIIQRQRRPVIHARHAESDPVFCSTTREIKQRRESYR